MPPLLARGSRQSRACWRRFPRSTPASWTWTLLPPGAIESLGSQRLRHVFMHELAHLKRKDVLVNWLMATLQVLHWFNPLIWYAFYRIRAERELACDAIVLSRAGLEDSPEYGKTIVHLLALIPYIFHLSFFPDFCNISVHP